MLGAIAISSVRACRHGDGAGGAGAACSAAFSPSWSVEFFGSVACSCALAGASGGRGLGSGTDRAATISPRADRLAPSCASPALSGDPAPWLRGDAGASVCGPTTSSNAPARAIAVSPQANPPQAHLRLAFLALNLMVIPIPATKN